jgi:hypothetical protein
VVKENLDGKSTVDGSGDAQYALLTDDRGTVMGVASQEYWQLAGRVATSGAQGGYVAGLQDALANDGIVGAGSQAEKENARLMDRYADPNCTGELPKQMVHWFSVGQ